MTARHAVLGIERASFFYGTNRVFRELSFQLDGARTALVGENGSGKSTLLKCLSGELELNAGRVVRSRGARVGALPQDIPAGLAGSSVREVLRRSLARLDRAEDDWRIDILLEEIGLPLDSAERAFGTLSGGWQRLLLIAAAARLEEPDILVLDEPTNHLDLGNIATLESWLTETFELPMLIVSHDRAFLDRVTERTLFLRSDGIHAFDARFSVAREELLRRDSAAAQRRRIEEREIQRLQQAAQRYAVWAVKNPDLNRRKKATESRIGRIEAARTAVYSTRERSLRLNDGELDARVALRIEGLEVTAPGGGRRLFSIDRLAIARGERVALLGINGAGKSTLLSLLAAAWDPSRPHYDGRAAIRFNPACRVVYFEQTLGGLPLDRSLADYIGAIDGIGEQNAVRLLAQAGFGFKRTRDPIELLSHGERSRLVFLAMRLQRPNLYLLDEPTNHLDIEGQEALEAELEETDVCCIFVSHDRYFTRVAATRFLEIRKGRLHEVDDAEAFFAAQRQSG